MPSNRFTAFAGTAAVVVWLLAVAASGATGKVFHLVSLMFLADIFSRVYALDGMWDMTTQAWVYSAVGMAPLLILGVLILAYRFRW